MTSPTSSKVHRLVTQTAEAADRELEPSGRPPEPNPYLAGEVIGDRYRLQRELGRGGMGVVWVAHSLVLGVDVAVKLIRASAAGPAIASRMAREAHAAARLGHPALVRVFDFGWTSRGDPFLVMELVQGETFAALLARELRIPAIRAVQMLLPIADGLRTAHDKNIVHRDIKPENIFLAADTFGRMQPKLLDFGIAKVDQATHEGKLTQFGAVLGSPEYMSPEQALGLDDIDERTDVWSFCVVLYELLSGTIPFRKANYNALMHAIINEEPRPVTDLGFADEALWLVLARGLAKERSERWSNMTELGEALALWLYEHGVKEDLSGNSIRAVWLDGALSGVRVEVPRSTPPERAGADSGAGRASLVSRAARTLKTHASGASPRVRGSANRRAVLVALAVGVAGGVALAATSFALRTPTTPPAASAAPVASAAAAVPAPLSSEPSAPPPSSAIVPEPTPPAPAPSAAPSTTHASAARSAPTAHRAVRSSGAARAPAKKRSHDFGF